MMDTSEPANAVGGMSGVCVAAASSNNKVSKSMKRKEKNLLAVRYAMDVFTFPFAFAFAFAFACTVGCVRCVPLQSVLSHTLPVALKYTLLT